MENLAALDSLKDFIKGRTFDGGAVLINVPLMPLDRIEKQVARNKGYFAYPPTTQLYLSAIFRDAGIPTTILDLNYVLLTEAQKDDPQYQAAWDKAIADAAKAFAKPLICLSLMFETTFEHAADICRAFRKVCPDATIIAGGVAATSDPEALLKDKLVDIVFKHEVERSLPEFLALSKGADDAQITNLVFTDAKGVTHNLGGETGSPVDIDIRSEYAKINIADYCNVGSLSSLSRMNGREVPYATVLSRRGCRAKCSFCGVRNFNGPGVRVRDVDGVVDEMEFLRQNHGIRHFDWLDDDLLYNRNEALRLFNKIAERLPDITWVANNGLIAAAIDADILDAMRRSGCIAYRIGLESGHPDVLRQVHKPTNLDRFFEFAKLAESFPEMLVSVNFIIGFPTETIEQMRASFVAAACAGLDWNSFYVYQHLKNTEMYLANSDVTRAGFETDYSKEGQMLKAYLRDINVVRGSGFKDLELDNNVVRGYDVFDLPDAMVPDHAQLKEVWFTYNTVANFLLMPALTNPAKLPNGVKWVRSLQHPYPKDAAMACLLYILEYRLGNLPKADIEALRQDAVDKLKDSEYWQARDRMFHFSAMLDNENPAIDPKALHFLNAAGRGRFAKG